jgi:hypothetical protein
VKLLFDQGVPVPLRAHLHGHDVDTSAEIGWSQRENGELIVGAEEAGYDALVTTDQNIRYQQNLESRSIAILVLMTTSWPRIKADIESVSGAVDALESGGYAELNVQ